MVDISDMDQDFGIYTPKDLMDRAEIRKGDILIINTNHTGHALVRKACQQAASQGTMVCYTSRYNLRRRGRHPLRLRRMSLCRQNTIPYPILQNQKKSFMSKLRTCL